jgi:5-methylcytosine-specific restriction protein A
MTRKQFVESTGATCSNWANSWSFVNDAEKFVIFGAWDIYEKGKRQKIFDEEWKVNWRGRKPTSYEQSRKHIRLVEQKNYQLKTFPQKYSNERRDKDEKGAAKIGGFTPTLTNKILLKIGNAWYADDSDSNDYLLPEELPASGKFWEGEKTQVTINAYERNPKARAACITHHGCKCLVCGFDFEKKYGVVGKGRIHVHHLNPIGKIGKQYTIDPKTDLIPVCPNCHFIIHLAEPPLTVEQVRSCIA